MRVAIASDHAAVSLKATLVAWLREAGHDVLDLGPATDARVDYPDYGYKLAESVASGDAARGIALCGSGIGISIAVNRERACRCALVAEPLSAALARRQPARVRTPALAPSRGADVAPCGKSILRGEG